MNNFIRKKDSKREKKSLWLKKIKVRYHQHKGKLLDLYNKGSTLFNSFPRLFLAIKREKVEEELYFSTMILKNLGLFGGEQPLSCDYMMEQLVDNTKVLKPYYMVVLSEYRKGKDRFNYLYEKIPLKTMRTFSLILSKLDKIHPRELVTYMDSFQKSIREAKMTRNLNRNSRNAIITNVVATGSAFVLILDFTVVVVFMTTMNMMEEIF